MIRLRYIWIKSFSVNDVNHVRFFKRFWSTLRCTWTVHVGRPRNRPFRGLNRARTSFRTVTFRNLLLTSPSNPFFSFSGSQFISEIVLFQFLTPSLISSRVLTQVLWHWEQAPMRIFCLKVIRNICWVVCLFTVCLINI